MNIRIDWRKILKELTLFSLFFHPKQNKVSRLYWALSNNNSFCNKKLYMNLGYWKNCPANLDEAGDQLAHLLSEMAALNSEHMVLDVGFGFGDQDRYWLKQFAPKKIVGINICANQIAQAKVQLEKEGIEPGKIVYLEADAAQIPFLDASFDIVFSLEAPFHFRTREKFFHEAYRVLKPGGKLVMTDLITSNAANTFKNRVMQALGCNFWQVPKANRYNMNTYNEKLHCSGFNNINTRSIWNEVYPHWLEFIKTMINSPQIKERFSFIFRNFLLTSLKAKRKNRQELMDYILVYAQKPHILCHLRES